MSGLWWCMSGLEMVLVGILNVAGTGEQEPVGRVLLLSAMLRLAVAF